MSYTNNFTERNLQREYTMQPRNEQKENDYSDSESGVVTKDNLNFLSPTIDFK